MTDSFELHRFVDAQAPVYAQVMSEIRSGRKRSHWMWFIFPQMPAWDTARWLAATPSHLGAKPCLPGAPRSRFKVARVDADRLRAQPPPYAVQCIA